MDEIKEALEILEEKRSNQPVAPTPVKHEKQQSVTEQDVAKLIWDIAAISPEHGNMLMNILGNKNYLKVMRLANGKKK